VNAANGTPFAVRYLPLGETYGVRGTLTVERRPLVEFWDTRYPFETIALGLAGQFTGGRYNAETIAAAVGGLVLDTHTPAWTLDAETMATVRAWLLDRMNNG
jgi:hypothetical protein